MNDLSQVLFENICNANQASADFAKAEREACERRYAQVVRQANDLLDHLDAEWCFYPRLMLEADRLRRALEAAKL